MVKSVRVLCELTQRWLDSLWQNHEGRSTNQDSENSGLKTVSASLGSGARQRTEIQCRYRKPFDVMLMFKVLIL